MYISDECTTFDRATTGGIIYINGVDIIFQGAECSISGNREITIPPDANQRPFINLGCVNPNVACIADRMTVHIQRDSTSHDTSIRKDCVFQHRHRATIRRRDSVGQVLIVHSVDLSGRIFSGQRNHGIPGVLAVLFCCHNVSVCHKIGNRILCMTFRRIIVFECTTIDNDFCIAIINQIEVPVIPGI